MIPSCPSANATVVTNILSAKGSRKPPSTDWSHRSGSSSGEITKGSNGGQDFNTKVDTKQGLWVGVEKERHCLFSDRGEKKHTKLGNRVNLPSLLNTAVERVSLVDAIGQNTGVCPKTL